MAIGLVDDSEFEVELDKSLPLTKKDKVIEGEVVSIPLSNEEHGRNKGDKNLPDSVRMLIGETSAIDGRTEGQKLADFFQVSPSSVSAYSKGSVSTSSYNKPKKNILDHINKSKLRTAKSAIGKLNLAIESITSDKLIETSAKDLSSIARNMAGVVKDMIPSADNDNNNGLNMPQFVLYAPQLVQENHFEVISVEE